MVGEHNLHSAQEEYGDRGGGGGLCLTHFYVLMRKPEKE